MFPPAARAASEKRCTLRECRVFPRLGQRRNKATGLRRFFQQSLNQTALGTVLFFREIQRISNYSSETLAQKAASTSHSFTDRDRMSLLSASKILMELWKAV